MNEQISEGVVYQVDGQGGYNLRSRPVAPLKNNVVPVKQPATLAKKVVVLSKKVAITSKALQKPTPSAIPDQVQINFPGHEVRFLDRMQYSFNLES